MTLGKFFGPKMLFFEPQPKNVGKPWMEQETDKPMFSSELLFLGLMRIRLPWHSAPNCRVTDTILLVFALKQPRGYPFDQKGITEQNRK